MNLGDGLVFELSNGKPRLILTNHGIEKNPNKILSRHRPQNVLNSKQHVSKELLVSEEPTRVQGRHRQTRRTAAATAPNAEGTKDETPLVACNPSRTRVNGTKGPSRVQPSDRHRLDGSSRAAEVTARESMVCLTSSQLQQILISINKGSSGSTQSQDTHSPTNTGIGEDSREVAVVLNNGTGAAGGGETSGRNLLTNNGSSQEKQEEDKRTLNGLFTSLGEREKDKEALEAQRTRWRRDLDDQVAMRRHQRATPEVPAEGARRTGAGVEDTDTLRSAQSYSSQRDLPAAIRSAFVLGEASPVDHGFSVQKREQQRLWLQELNQQRDEVKLRRRHERQQRCQAEDQELWTVHFDSLQKRLPPQPPPPAAERAESEALSSLSHQRAPSGALSLTWEASSTYGGDSLGRASVDTAGTLPQRASHLRTMTALLDPAQIEDRERKRFKQLEHQRAIEAQVEERRRQREQEEASRLALEEQEERRVEAERRLLQEQYQLDTQRQRHKEELAERQTEQLHQSVQRAQEDALKDKHQQRIRDLSRKGHDVSKLLRPLEGSPAAPPHVPTVRESPNPGQEVRAGPGEGASGLVSPRRDTAVQTDIDSAHPAFSARGQAGARTPDVPVEYRPLPPLNAKRLRRDAGPAQQRHQGAGKENVCLNQRGGGGGGGGGAAGGADPYEAFAGTRGAVPGPRGGGGRRPEWNTQRPSQRFVPASERYPAGLQQSRQESRLRRQMELMTLVERNAASRTPQPDRGPPPPPQPDPTTGRTRPRPGSPRKSENSDRGNATAVHMDRGRSPPVPAVKHRLQTRTQQLPHAPAPEARSPPPSAEFVPYMRTDEVYHLDPLAPLSRPPTQPQTHADVPRSGTGTPGFQRDPLLHPDLLKNRARQQAILKSLSELRQGLLQKQREMETGLNPLLKINEGNQNHSPPLQHVTHSP